jgi:hypothetical protein
MSMRRGDKQERTFEGAPETGLGVHWDVPTSVDSSGKRQTDS